MAKPFQRTFAADPAPGTGQGRTVLVVDPDRTGRTVIANLLRPEGYRVLEVERADKALFLALEKSIDAFLIAQSTGGLEMADFCARIRALDRYRQVPILSILLPFDEDAARAAFAAGADDFLTRPVNAHALRTRLAGRLQRMRVGSPEQPPLAAYLAPHVRRLLPGGAELGGVQSRDTREVCVLAVRLEIAQGSPSAHFRKVVAHLGAQVDCVYRHGGYVARLEADGMRAVFETSDRIARAAACALALHGELAVAGDRGSEGSLHMRASLCEGLLPAVAGGLATDRAADVLVKGAELCARAQANEILVTDPVGKRLGAVTLPFVVDAHGMAGRMRGGQREDGDQPPARPRAA